MNHKCILKVSMYLDQLNINVHLVLLNTRSSRNERERGRERKEVRGMEMHDFQSRDRIHAPAINQ